MPRCAGKFVLWVALAATSGAAQDARSQLDAQRFPARDSHQGVTIAARPVTNTAEAEAIFGKKAAPTRVGVLPVELIVINERTQAIRVTLERILVVTESGKFEQVEPKDIVWALYPPPEKTKPGKKPSKKDRGKRSKREEAEAALRHRQLRAAVVAPGGAAHGFRYFALGEKSIDLAASSVYIPEVELVSTGERLLFFEISLKPYAQPKP